LEALAPQYLAATVEIETSGGSLVSATVKAPKGDSENPLARDELVEKFRELAGAVVPASRVRALEDAVLALETISDMTDLACLLRPGQAKAPAVKAPGD
jgi:2-methylcitrate dehydratase PrpD